MPPAPCDVARRREVTRGLIGSACGSVPPPGRQSCSIHAEAFWRNRGRDVRVRGRNGRFPAVFATADPGWTFALQVIPERDEAPLSGGTPPCLPDPSA